MTDAPERTPLSERLDALRNAFPDVKAADIESGDLLDEIEAAIIHFVSEVAALEQERDEWQERDDVRCRLIAEQGAEVEDLQAAIREALECADEDEVTERHQDGTICGICVKRLRRALTKPEGEE